jgi:hypothetical protein
LSAQADAAWFFLSIGDAGGRDGWASLRDVIGSADSNNHSIPTANELSQGVSRLVAAGLVQTDGSRTQLTEGGREAFDTANRHGRGHIDRMLILSKAWEEAGFPPASPTTWSVSEAEFAAAYAEYHAWAQEAIARISRDIRRR